MMLILRSILFTVIMFISIVPLTILVIILRPFGHKTSYNTALVWPRFITWACKILCRLDYSIEGEENIPEKNCVVFIKHSSAYETIAQLILFPRQTWVLKRELMWAPFLGWALACLYPIAINRNARRIAIAQVIEQGKNRLAKGLWVMIFPEGTRMRAGGTRRYGVSGTLLAQEANTVILPVAHNAGDFWPRRGWRKHPGTIRFVIGPPIDPAGREAREVNEEIQSWIETKIAELRN
ncbi:MAG: lysophospholipid acyltransferase family protein [Gammaproteobacteria bacterium]|jgi:1-acyl-sn-glycerol-3-phosphate acyltransferase|nr:1-acyl-sn-glycerol-3-phosphate acyltransferase [Chromatiales bacterium]MDP6673740.1 lysophospholipid acyltransferase family protein [Gammaproteobacteria bacterium]